MPKIRLGARTLLTLLAALGAGSFLVLGLFLVFTDSRERATTERRIRESVAIGDSVVLQLDRYRTDHGDFPRRLDELVPRYVGTLPDTATGVRWEYESDGRSFNLGFSVGEDHYPNGCILSDSRRWFIDD